MMKFLTHLEGSVAVFIFHHHWFNKDLHHSARFVPGICCASLIKHLPVIFSYTSSCNSGLAILAWFIFSVNGGQVCYHSTSKFGDCVTCRCSPSFTLVQVLQIELLCQNICKDSLVLNRLQSTTDASLIALHRSSISIISATRGKSRLWKWSSDTYSSSFKSLKLK